MKMANDWNTTRAAMSGDGERLSLGGHVCRIMNARVEERAGHEVMVLSFDIDEGSEYDGFFRRQYDRFKDSSATPQWPMGGTFSQFTRDYKDPNKTNPYFKGLIQAITDSNPNFVWNWDEKSLKGKAIGLVFGEEEYKGRDGEIKTSTRARYCCSAESAPEKDAPKLKEYKGAKPAANQFTEVDDDELPF